jgi:hypothetical protein
VTGARARRGDTRRIVAGARARRAGTTRSVAVALAVALVGGLVAAVAGAVAGSSGGGGDPGGGTAAPTVTATTMNTGGIDVPAPAGWTAIPVASLGFGIAVPPGWEATVLAPDVLASLERASPEVPGFLDLAHAAAAAGAVFYAAGEDAAGRAADVKVRAVPGAGVGDVGQLEDYADYLVATGGLEGATVEPVDGAHPTVRIRYRVATDPAAAGPAEPVEADGTETLVAGPGDILWSVIVTSEDPAAHDALATQITGSLSFPPR